MTTKPAALAIEGLSVTYGGGFRAVDDVSLRVDCGESVAIVGESGSGKSSMLRAILGLLPPRARVGGQVRLGDTVLDALGGRDLARVRLSVGYVTQDPYSAYDPLRTVRHHVLEPLRIRRIKRDDALTLRRLSDAGVLDPDARWKQHPHQWSGGMLQRGDIIAATQHDPEITLADEPTSALDAELADGMMTVLREQSKALLFVTHDLELAAAHADRIIVLAGGKVIEEAPGRQLFGAPAHPQTARLIGAIKERSAPRARPTDTAGRVVIEASSVTKRYRTGQGTIAAVDGVDLLVRAGQIVGIHGRSGSGKSTLLRLLGGLERPDTGTVTIESGTGVVLPIFQDPVGSLDPRWPLWRTITEPLTARGRRPRPGERRISTPQRKELAREALDRVGLARIDVHSYPTALSVGQCQRIAIARAWCAAPPVVIADEPTASLDVTTASEIARLLRRLRDRGTALVIVSHDLALLGLVADRVLQMADGRLIRARPCHRTTSAQSSRAEEIPW